MMALHQNPNEYAFVLAMDGPPTRKRLTGAPAAAIGFTLVAHLALGVYLYRMHVSTAAPPTGEDPIMTVSTVKLDPTPPMQPALPPRQRTIAIHHPILTDPSVGEVLPPVIKTPPVRDDRPPVLPTETSTSSPPAQPKLIGNPNWLRRPDGAQLTKYYPPRAMDQEIAGSATLTCVVTASGRLNACRVAAETPAGEGFGEAAMKLSAFFQMSPRTVDGQPVDGGVVRIPIRFSLGG
jgi:protein TonB